MNKLERFLKERYKWIRRIKALGLWNKGNPEKFTLAWRSQTKPCSCYICSPNKYSRKEKHRKDIVLENTEFHTDLITELHGRK